MTAPTTAAHHRHLSARHHWLALLIVLLLGATEAVAPGSATAQPTAGLSNSAAVDGEGRLPGAATELNVVAPTQQNGHSAPVDYRANPWRQTAAKTWAFAQCIFGVGVPIGIAWGLATTPQFWGWVAGFSPMPTWTTGAQRYGQAVKRNCRWALFG